MSTCVECSSSIPDTEKKYPYDLCKACYFTPSIAKKYRAGGIKIDTQPTCGCAGCQSGFGCSCSATPTIVTPPQASPPPTSYPYCFPFLNPDPGDQDDNQLAGPISQIGPVGPSGPPSAGPVGPFNPYVGSTGVSGPAGPPLAAYYPADLPSVWEVSSDQKMKIARQNAINDFIGRLRDEEPRNPRRIQPPVKIGDGELDRSVETNLPVSFVNKQDKLAADVIQIKSLLFSICGKLGIEIPTDLIDEYTGLKSIGYDWKTEIERSKRDSGFVEQVSKPPKQPNLVIDQPHPNTLISTDDGFVKYRDVIEVRRFNATSCCLMARPQPTSPISVWNITGEAATKLTMDFFSVHGCYREFPIAVDFMNKDWEVTVKKDLVPDDKVYQVTNPFYGDSNK